MTNINWQMGNPPKNGNYLVETKDDFVVDYWFEHAWDDNGNNVIAWLPIEGDRVEVVRCKDCKYYKQSAVADRKMCFRKDVDGVEVCYDFLPYDSCTYGERKDEVEND